eukprot:TRINITY_DN11840_c0_g1_i1.p2 TRINITY_DN11840_c0_g1~~TRINITY_DN11840_c0_g1_i1.p2  ORF type:complete len:270 (+),score=77.99 TRINITY_DN11840_c0_g1_i1:77-811(+)
MQPRDDSALGTHDTWSGAPLALPYAAEEELARLSIPVPEETPALTTPAAAAHAPRDWRFAAPRPADPPPCQRRRKPPLPAAARDPPPRRRPREGERCRGAAGSAAAAAYTLACDLARAGLEQAGQLELQLQAQQARARRRRAAAAREAVQARRLRDLAWSHNASEARRRGRELQQEHLTRLALRKHMYDVVHACLADPRFAAARRPAPRCPAAQPGSSPAPPPPGASPSSQPAEPEARGRLSPA